MEQDRFQKNHTLFILGMFSLIASMTLLALSFYIMPNLLFGWIYDVPRFIINWVEMIKIRYNYSAAVASQLIFFFLFLLAVFFGIIAYFSSNRIDNDIYSAELNEEAEAQPSKIKTTAISDAPRLALKILFVSLLVFIFIKVFEWIIYTPTPAPQLNQFRRMTNH